MKFWNKLWIIVLLGLTIAAGAQIIIFHQIHRGGIGGFAIIDILQTT